MSKILSMINCNAASIINEFLRVAVLTACATSLSMTFFNVELKIIEAISGWALSVSLMIFLFRMLGRLTADGVLLESRERQAEIDRVINHDMLKLATVWAVVLVPWILYWLSQWFLSNYLLTAFMR